MNRALIPSSPQSIPAVATVIVAALTAVIGWVVGAGEVWPDTSGSSTTPLALALLAAIVLAHRLRITRNPALRVSMVTVPLYLSAVMLPPPLALIVAGLGVLAGEVLTLGEAGRPLGIVLAGGARWVPVTYVTSVVAHLPMPISHIGVLPLVLAALTMCAGDTVTAPVGVMPMTGEPPHVIMAMVLRAGGVAMMAQYLVGVLAALVAAREPWTLVLFTVPTLLVYLSFKRARDLESTTRGLLEGMADAVDLRDPYTGGHSRRVTDYTAGILRQMGRSAAEVELIVAAARVHDIGKIGVPDVVLKKPGPLTKQERALMEQHAERGAYLLRRYPDFARGVAIVRHHHEAWDGTGYPHRLAGTDIPFGSRVIAVADAFDAMTSDRPYRRGMLAQHAAQILRDGRHRQWDAAVVDAFLASLAEDPEAPRTAPLQIVHRSTNDAARA